MQERETKRAATPESSGWPDDDFSADLGHGTSEHTDHGDPTEETRMLANHESLPPELDGLDRGRRGDVVVLADGTQLRQGSVYIDLDDVAAGPFVALANQRAEPGQRLVPKHRVDHELWNALAGDREPVTVRPEEKR